MTHTAIGIATTPVGDVGRSCAIANAAHEWRIRPSVSATPAAFGFLAGMADAAPARRFREHRPT